MNRCLTNHKSYLYFQLDKILIMHACDSNANVCIHYFHLQTSAPRILQNFNYTQSRTSVIIPHMYVSNAIYHYRPSHETPEARLQSLHFLFTHIIRKRLAPTWKEAGIREKCRIFSNTNTHWYSGAFSPYKYWFGAQMSPRDCGKFSTLFDYGFSCGCFSRFGKYFEHWVG